MLQYEILNINVNPKPAILNPYQQGLDFVPANTPQLPKEHPTSAEEALRHADSSVEAPAPMALARVPLRDPLGFYNRVPLKGTKGFNNRQGSFKGSFRVL